MSDKPAAATERLKLARRADCYRVLKPLCRAMEQLYTREAVVAALQDVLILINVVNKK
jgi:hypothetical protein